MFWKVVKIDSVWKLQIEAIWKAVTKSTHLKREGWK